MTEPRTCDVLVVGGGATGAGILRDLARRGLRGLLVDRGDFGTGTSGRFHGLLHSGGRYVVKDPEAARECIAENKVLRRVAAATIEDTGAYYVATPDDPDDYVERFPRACEEAGIECRDVRLVDAFHREPSLSREIRKVFGLPDGSIDGWELIGANLDDARGRGSEALPYTQVVGFELVGERIVGARLADVRSGDISVVHPRFVVSAAGAWAGKVAALAGVTVSMTPGKGVMLVYNQRMTDTVVHRCHMPADGDIMVPIHSVAILGTTDERVPDPDDDRVSREDVERLIGEGEKLFPALRQMRLLRAYAGVRPLYQPPASAAAENRSVSRAHQVVDHANDGVDNFVSIVGGKLTTYRLMARDTVDVVAARLGVSARCTTADEPLPGSRKSRVGRAPMYWLGHRLAAHEAEGGGDANLICECEMVTRSMLNAFLDERWPCSFDDVRRATRLGMGPCQGAFCTFRAGGLVAARASGANGANGTRGTNGAGRTGGANRPANVALADPADVDRAIVGYMEERFKGTRPVAAGRQLQELWMAMGIYLGTLGIESLIERPPSAETPPGETNDGTARPRPRRSTRRRSEVHDAQG